MLPRWRMARRSSASKHTEPPDRTLSNPFPAEQARVAVEGCVNGCDGGARTIRSDGRGVSVTVVARIHSASTRWTELGALVRRPSAVLLSARSKSVLRTRVRCRWAVTMMMALCVHCSWTCDCSLCCVSVARLRPRVAGARDGQTTIAAASCRVGEGAESRSKA